MTPIDNNNHKGVVVAQQTFPYLTKPVQTPDTYRSQGKEPNKHISWGSDSDTKVANKCRSTTSRERSASTIIPSRGHHRAHSIQQSTDRHTSSSEAKIDTECTHGRRHATTKSYPMINQEEPFTDRDVRLIPDRSKTFAHR